MQAHRVTTTDKEEAKRTGKEYLSETFYREMNKLKKPKVHRCAYCQNPINKWSENDNIQKYCSQWCLQQDKYYDAMIRKRKLST